MIIYLLKMIACSAAFYALYAFLFQKEKMFVFNRVYLLGSLLLSFLIPLITFEVSVPTTALYRYNEINRPVAYTKSEPSLSHYLPYVFYTVTAIVSVFLLIRFIKNIVRLKRCMSRYKRVHINDTKISLLDEPVVPHSFLDTIFLNKKEYEQGGIEAEVLAHELAHVRQRHSLDILFIELLQIFCWFNPMLYLYKRSIKVNHELLADAAVIEQFDNVHDYQHILLQRSGIKAAMMMASSFNFLITKKRLIMLQKKFNKKRTTWYALMVLPLSVALTFSFCNRVEKKEKPADTKIIADAEAQTSRQDTAPYDSVGNVQDSNANAALPPEIKVVKFPPPKVVLSKPDGPGVTQEMLNVYESIIKEMKVGENRYRHLDAADVKWKQLISIYHQMTVEQRNDASQLPPPPPPPVEPKPVPAPPPPKEGKKKLPPPKVVKDVEVKEVSISETSNEKSPNKTIKKSVTKTTQSSGKKMVLYIMKLPFRR